MNMDHLYNMALDTEPDNMAGCLSDTKWQKLNLRKNLDTISLPGLFLISGLKDMEHIYPKSGVGNDSIYPSPKSRSGALVPQWG